MTLPLLDLDFAAGRDEAPAITCDGERLSYADLRRRAAAITARLSTLGLRRGERFGALLANGPNVIAFYMACARAGVVGVPLSRRLTAAELEFQLADSGAKAVMFSAEFAPLVAAVSDRLPLVKAWIDEAEFERSAVDASAPAFAGSGSDGAPAPDDPFCIMYTGGTTGGPKAAVQTRAGWACCLQATVDAWQATPADRHLISLPMSHAAWFSAGATLLAGGHVTILRTWDPLHALEAIVRERITTLNMIPTMLGDLVKAHEQHPELPRRMHTVRLLTVAGSLLPEATYARATAILGPVVGNIYGLTEAAGPVTFLMPHEMQGDARNSVGRPNPFIEIAILDDDGRPTDGSTAGEIGLAGPQVTPGYWQRPAETRAAFAGRWLKTGDMARLDELGRVWLGDRKKDMIKSGGYNVYPSEVEQVIYRHPAVQECAVFGMPDERWIEAVHAVVVLRPGHAGAGQAATLADILAACRAALAAHKVPKALHALAELPRTRFGKFDKAAAARQLV